MLDCVDQLSMPAAAAAAAAAMCSGLDVTDTTHERSGSTTAHKRRKLKRYSDVLVLAYRNSELSIISLSTLAAEDEIGFVMEGQENLRRSIISAKGNREKEKESERWTEG